MVLLCVSIKAKKGAAEAYLRELRERKLLRRPCWSPAAGSTISSARRMTRPRADGRKLGVGGSFPGPYAGGKHEDFVELQKAYIADIKADKFSV